MKRAKMKAKHFRNFLMLTVAGATIACSAPKRESFTIALTAQADDGQPLAGVTVYSGDKALGTTTSGGALSVELEATSGAEFPIRFTCPKDFSATRDTIVVPLRSANSVEDEKAASDQLKVGLECKPTKRKAMVVIKADMQNIPIKMGNETLGMTNDKGIAYLSMRFRPKEVFELHLDTSSNDFMYPRNPHFPFVMPDRDEVFIVQEDFRIVEPPPPPPVVKTKKIRKGKKKPDKKPEAKKPPVRINL